MQRKKWTANTELTESLLHFREKRKWQIALRRYLLTKNKSSFYAPYFGLDIEKFREWITIQFSEDLHWNNFSTAWQFDHIVPVAYFDFADDDDLRLCWNFTNIRVEKLVQNKNRGNRIDVLAAKGYFESLFEKTGYSVCKQMVEKITRIEASEIASSKPLEDFIVTHKSYLDTTAVFSVEDFKQLNSGRELKSILFEKDFLKRLGS